MTIIEMTKSVEEDGNLVHGCAIVQIRSLHVFGVIDGAHMEETVQCELPYDQLLDHNDMTDYLEEEATMDDLANSLLQLNTKINEQSVLLDDPRKATYDPTARMGQRPFVSLRPKLLFDALNRIEQHAAALVVTTAPPPTPSTPINNGPQPTIAPVTDASKTRPPDSQASDDLSCSNSSRLLSTQSSVSSASSEGEPFLEQSKTLRQKKKQQNKKQQKKTKPKKKAPNKDRRQWRSTPLDKNKAHAPGPSSTQSVSHQPSVADLFPPTSAAKQSAKAAPHSSSTGMGQAP